MTKQERIREGMAIIQCNDNDLGLRYGYWDKLSDDEREEYLVEVDTLLGYLHSQGVKLSDGSNLIEEARND